MDRGAAMKAEAATRVTGCGRAFPSLEKRF